MAKTWHTSLATTAIIVGLLLHVAGSMHHCLRAFTGLKPQLSGVLPATPDVIEAGAVFEFVGHGPNIRTVAATAAVGHLGWPVVAGGLAVAFAAAMVRRPASSRSRVVLAAKVDLEAGEKVVGIDLGTTNSAVAAMEAGRPTIIPNKEGGRTTPSVVAFKDGELLLGQIAKRQGAINPSNTFYSVKRFMGRQSDEVREEIAEVAYEVETSGNRIQLNCPSMGLKLSPEDVAAQVLTKLSNDAKQFLSADIRKAVITVPAYFNDAQRQATKDAGKIAGLDVLRILNEPTAASLAYGLDNKTNETIMVFDLGGGTFDVSVLQVGDGVCEVLATSGDSRLGGDDFDARIVGWLADDFEVTYGLDLRQDPQALQRLTEAAEKAKVELSGAQEVTVSLPFIAVDADGPKNIEETLSRTKFELLISDLLKRCRGPVQQALEDAELTAKDLGEVVLVGGSTRIPAVQALARELSGGRYPNQSVNPDEVVAVGAALQAGVLTGEVRNLMLLDVIPLSLSVATHDGMSSVFMKRNSRVPLKKTKVYSTARDGQTRVDVRVVQGERQFAKDNKTLGLFFLDGIPAAPSGFAQVEVTFDVDSNGILTVSAKEKVTQKQQTVTINRSSTLAPEDVERKVRDAAKWSAEEIRLQYIIQARNAAETAAFGVERLLREKKGSFNAATVELLESKVLVARKEISRQNPDVDLLKAVTEDLQEELKKADQELFKQKWDKDQGFELEEDEVNAALGQNKKKSKAGKKSVTL